MKRLVCLALTIHKVSENSQKNITKFTFNAKWHESRKHQTTEIWSYTVYKVNRTELSLGIKDGIYVSLNQTKHMKIPTHVSLNYLDTLSY